MMMKRKLFSTLVLLVMAATGVVAQNYKVSVKEGTEDATNWSINPAEATTTGVAQGTQVTVTYSGLKKVKSVKAVKKAPAGTTVDLSTLTGNYEAQDGDVLTGTLAANVKITIADGATVTLSGAVINGTNSSSWAGLTLAGDGTIILSGENTVKGFYDEYPGIFVPVNKTLTIQGDGSLTASSNGWAAGIGGGYEKACGNITIEGGTINAQGGSDAAGIGGGYNTSCGNISITGGTVTATGGNYAAGIGSGSSDGYDSSCGNITITDGVTKVTATAGQSAPNSIGVGMGGSCGTVTIGGTVYPDGISTSPYTYDPSAPAEPAAPTLAETLTTAGMTVKVNFNYNSEVCYCQFLSNGDGTYTFQSGGGYAGGQVSCAKALVVDEDGKLVFKQNTSDPIDDMWKWQGYSVTFDTSNNTYSEWIGGDNYFQPSFISVEVNGATIAVTAAQ